MSLKTRKKFTIHGSFIKVNSSTPPHTPPIQTYLCPHLTSESSVQSALSPSCCAELIASVIWERELGDRNVFAQYTGLLLFRNNQIKIIWKGVSLQDINRGRFSFCELGLQIGIKAAVFGRKNVFFNLMVQDLESENSLMLSVYFMLCLLLNNRWNWGLCTQYQKR